MLVLAVLVLAVLPCRCYVRPARAIDAACSLPTGCIELGSAHLQESRERALRDAYRVLPSFGSVREPPHAPRDDMLVAELEEISGLPAAAFAPSVPAKSAVPNNLPAASAAVCIQLLLAAAALSDSQPLAEAKRGLRGMDWWQISPLFLGLASGSVLLAAVVDKLLLRGAVLTLFTRLVQPPARREAVLRHEAGHFLLSHLLGFPVQACELDPLAALVDRRFGGAAGTIFYRHGVWTALRIDNNNNAAADATRTALRATPWIRPRPLRALPPPKRGCSRWRRRAHSTSDWTVL
jgi:hypothetical protein